MSVVGIFMLFLYLFLRVFNNESEVRISISVHNPNKSYVNRITKNVKEPASISHEIIEMPYNKKEEKDK